MGTSMHGPTMGCDIVAGRLEMYTAELAGSIQDMWNDYNTLRWAKWMDEKLFGDPLLDTTQAERDNREERVKEYVGHVHDKLLNQLSRTPCPTGMDSCSQSFASSA